MGSITQERERLKAFYHGKSWWDKVDDMSDAQVVAVLRRLEEQRAKSKEKTK